MLVLASRLPGRALLEDSRGGENSVGKARLTKRARVPSCPRWPSTCSVCPPRGLPSLADGTLGFSLVGTGPDSCWPVSHSRTGLQGVSGHSCISRAQLDLVGAC